MKSRFFGETVLIAALLFIGAVPSWGKWDQPEKVLSGKYGSSVAEFGFRQEYIEKVVPSFKVESNDGNILVADTLNKRIKITQKTVIF